MNIFTIHSISSNWSEIGEKSPTQGGCSFWLHCRLYSGIPLLPPRDYQGEAFLMDLKSIISGCFSIFWSRWETHFLLINTSNSSNLRDSHLLLKRDPSNGKPRSAHLHHFNWWDPGRDARIHDPWKRRRSQPRTTLLWFHAFHRWRRKGHPTENFAGHRSFQVPFCFIVFLFFFFLFLFLLPQMGTARWPNVQIIVQLPFSEKLYCEVVKDFGFC